MDKPVETEGDLVRLLSMPIYQTKGWMKLVAVLSVIYGAGLVLTIVGIVVAWLPIWLGIVLYQAASKIEEAELTGNGQALVESMHKLKTYFTLMGILSLIGLIFYGLVFIGIVFTTIIEQAGIRL